jgi:hypothetical protein
MCVFLCVQYQLFEHSYLLNIVSLQFRRLGSLKCSYSELIPKQRVFLASTRTRGLLKARPELNTKLNPRKFRQVDGLQAEIVVSNPPNSNDFVMTIGPTMRFAEAVSYNKVKTKP